MKMEIKLFHSGHAGFAVLVNGMKIVLDHWSSSYRPFEGSWQKFEEDDFDVELLEILNNPDFVWCSHEHGDHFDPTYLKSISNSNVKFIIPDFEDQSFIKRYKQHGLSDEKLILLGDEKRLTLSDKINLTMFFEEPIYSNHSSLLLTLGSVKIFHNADTTPSEKFYEKLSRGNIGKITLFIGQYCNPTPYPWIIEMEAPEKEEEAFAMHHAALKTHINMVHF